MDTNPNPAHYIYCDCLALYIITKKSNMSNQVVFGAAAVAAVAGGAYIYEQNKQRHQIPVPETEKSIPAGRDIQDKLSKTVEQTKKELEAKSKYWTEKAKDTSLYKSTIDTKDAVEQKYDAVKTPLHEKNVFVQLVDRYIDLVNDLGSANKTTTPYSTSGPAEEVKEKQLFGGWFKSEDEKFRDDLKKKAEAEQKSWSLWGSKKADEAESTVNKAIDQGKDDLNKSASYLKDSYNDTKDKITSAFSSSETERLKQEAEEKKNSWSIWGQKKADEAESAYKDGKDSLFSKGKEVKEQAEKEKKSWFNWGSKKTDEVNEQLNKTSNEFTKQFEQSKAAAIEKYEEAKAQLDNLTKDFLQSKEPGKQEKLDAAKSDVESAFANLKLYGDDVYKELNQRFKGN